jgi:hypothetical protein
MLIVAFSMNCMTASHKNDCLRRREHVFAANRTVAVGRALDALVGLFHRNRHTEAAGLSIVREVYTWNMNNAPCNGRSPFPDLDRLCIYHNHCSDRYSY